LRCSEDTELIGFADHRKYKTPRQVREIVTDRVHRFGRPRHQALFAS
jgi:hypothetical protein